jgi:hypothetical protein
MLCRGVLDQLPEHDGRKRLSGDVFFGQPDDIGAISSASTGVNPGERRGGQHDPIFAVGIAFIVAILAASVVAGASGVHLDTLDQIPLRAWGAGGLAAIIVTLALRPTLWSTYVGATGVSRTGRAFGFRAGRPHGFQFSSAARLEVNMTRVYARGAYKGTNFRYEWLSPEDRVIFAIEGAFPEHDIRTEEPEIPRNLRRDHPVYFGRAAQAAWEKFSRR